MIDQKSFNSPKEVTVLLSVLPARQKDVISKRFGLKDGKRKTLEEIGDEYSITRERVRQIENDAKETLSESDHIKALDPFYTSLEGHFTSFGGVRPEHILFEKDTREIFLPTLRADVAQAHLTFLLSLHDLFERHSESNDFHAVWALKHTPPHAVKKSLTQLVERLHAHGQPLSRAQLFEWFAGLTGEEVAKHGEAIERVATLAHKTQRQRQVYIRKGMRDATNMLSELEGKTLVVKGQLKINYFGSAIIRNVPKCYKE